MFMILSVHVDAHEKYVFSYFVHVQVYIRVQDVNVEIHEHV
jgi:hypothetical protein